MEADDGLSQAMFAGSQDERPEIGYGGGDLVQSEWLLRTIHVHFDLSLNPSSWNGISIDLCIV